MWENADGSDVDYLPRSSNASAPWCEERGAHVALTAERGVAPVTAGQFCGTAEVPRTGMCLRHEQIKTEAWWPPEKGQGPMQQGQLVQPWGAAVALDGAHAVVSDAASNALFVLDIQSGAVSVLAGQRVSGHTKRLAP